MSVENNKNIIKNKFMKKFFVVFLICMLQVFIPPSFSKEDFKKIYEELEPVDFEYIFGIDPFQAQEYKQYMFSPYPLLRTGVNFIFKDTIIPPGYYLLTPRKHEGKTYILFKEGGRVKYAVPVYNVDITTEEFYDQYIPKPKTTKWQRFKTAIADKAGTMFPEKTQRKPIPKTYMEINDIDGEFFQIILYYGTGKYYLIFKQDKEE